MGRIFRRCVVNALLTRHKKIVWVTWLVAALLFLAVGNGLVYGLAILLTAGLLVLIAPGLLPSTGRQVDGRDIRVVLLLYVGVVASLYLAFQVFTVQRTLGLFLCYAGGLMLGVVGPVVYTVWGRGRPLADLGLSRQNWRQALVLGLILGLSSRRCSSVRPRVCHRGRNTIRTAYSSPLRTSDMGCSTLLSSSSELRCSVRHRGSGALPPASLQSVEG